MPAPAPRPSNVETMDAVAFARFRKDLARCERTAKQPWVREMVRALANQVEIVGERITREQRFER